MANRRFIDFPIASTVGDNDIVLIWQDGANKQTTKATILSGLPENLDELNDVVISGLTNGQILRYDSVTGKWVNTDQGNLDLNDLNDVSIVSPSNGQVLVYNSSTSKWENSSGGFVPYVGAVTTVDLGAQGLRAGYVRFDTSVVTVPDEQGLMYWDASRSTVALIMNGTLQHIGQDSFFYVKNSSGSTIPKGTCVGFAGTDGGSGHLLITPFLANGSVPSTYFMGVTCESIANGSFGQVMHFGELEGINTSGFTAGALLYASSTVAGAFQTTAPVAPNNIILVAAAVNSKNNGAIVVRPTLGSNFGTNESVKLTSVTDKDLLQYTVTAGVGLWENKTLSQVIGSAYVPSTRTLTINGTAFDLSANRSWIVGDVRTDGSYSNPSWITALAWSKITGTPTTLSGYGITDAVPNSRTITINGVTQDLSANRSFNVGTVTSVGLSSATSGVTIGGSPVTGVGAFTLTIATASGSQQGLLSASDWTTFNNKQNALTNPVTGTGTTNYLPKFTGSTTIGNSAITDDGATVNLISRDLTITRGSYSGFSFGIDQQSSFAFGSTNGRRVAIIRDATAADNGLQFGYDTVDKTGIIAGAATSAGAGIDFYTFNGSAWGNRARVTASGNLLVGTTTDAGFRLDVNGSGVFRNTLALQSSGTNAALLSWTGSNNGLLNLYNGGSLTTQILANGNSYFNGGNVGIGTSSPFARLHVRNSDVNEGTIAIGNDNFPGLIYSNAFTGEFRIDNRSSAGAGYITFYPNGQQNTLGNEAMRIATSRNILIGTTTDNGARLQVNGFARFDRGTLQFTLNPSYAGGNVYSQLQSTGALALATGSDNNRLYIDINGNVGIGTASPGNFNGLSFASPILDVIGSLNVKGIASNGAAVINIGGETFRKAAIYTSIQDQGPYLGFAVGTSGTSSSANDVMRLTSGGNVLIGSTSDPGYKLFVNGNTYIRSAGNTSGSYGLVLQDSSANNLFLVRNDGASSFFGSVGIGTSNPQEPLHISTSGADKFIRIENSNSYTGIWMNDSGANNGWLLMSGYTNTTSPGDFAIREYGVQTSLVIKQTSGNVLIGTTTDNSQKLQVNGTGKFNGTLGATSALNVFKTDNTTIGAQFAYDSAINQLYLWNFISSGYFSIYTNSAERFRISSSGFVSAGETTNGRLGVRGFTNDSSGYAFEAANASGNTLFITRNDGASSFFGSVGINVLSPSYKMHISTTGTAENVFGITNGTQTLTLGVNNGSGGSFLFENTNNGLRFGTNGAERMRITSSGNVGINTTSGFNYVSGTETTLSIANGNVASLYLNSTSTGNLFALYSSAVGSLQVYNVTQNNYPLGITSGGNVMIGTTTDSGDRLRVNGSIRTANTTNRTADSWRLADARIDTIPNANRLLRVQIGSVEYDILARQVI